MKILIIEDDELITRALTAILTSQNYAVEVATDGQLGWELLDAFDYDLVLLDVMLPKVNGISLCHQARAKGLQMPILLLTGQDSSHNKAIGLDAGADDYVVKPFDPEELVARVRALLRRGGAIAQPILSWGELRFDPSSYDVSYDGQPLSLTPKESALLELFLRNPRRVFSCSMILEHLWAYEEMPGEEAVRTHIKGLRQKLKAAGVPTDVVETVYGIGYRLKPREPEKSPKSKKQKTKAANTEPGLAPTPSLATVAPQNSSGYPSEPNPQQTLASINKIWNRFKDRVSEQVSVLETAAIAVHQKKLNQDLRQQARQEAHTLAGSLGTFGFPEGSQLARQIEQLFQLERLSTNEITNLQKWVKGLRQEIERSRYNSTESLSGNSLIKTHSTFVETSEVMPAGISGVSHSATSNSATSEENRPSLLIVNSDRTFATQLTAEADTWCFRTKVATNLAKARTEILSESPDIVLLDLEIAPTVAESLSLLADLSKQVPPVPVVIVTEHHDLTERLEVARLGGRTLLQKSFSPAQMLETVTQVLHQAEQAKARVMVVDDDPALLAIVRSLLEPWGLKITTLANPQQFWEVLETATPDLLILDIEMPQISGIELCQVVRNDSRWGRLPILFLTAHTDADTVNQVFSVGADDFVSKPLVGPELVTRIINRLERIRFLRNLAETDPLTKLANRQKSTQDLETLLRLAKRQNQYLCLAVLDLDQFKQVNNCYGHAIGDEVLRQIGQMLRCSFRAEDVVARWGGEEFVIGMYSMTKQDGAHRLDSLLATLRQKVFPAANGSQSSAETSNTFHVTFSAGVAQYPNDGRDLHSLYQVAAAALYQAKASGQNCVLSVEAIPASSRSSMHSL